ncbi:TMEM165/GDT1 family protein [Sphingomonas sp. PR090111-T3T-6A]|uniref:TMEM165/GDT1 family protein n=1 Tax=Sphingomonas sp. PR090111-T3T-6A TaxID=685778 RepID=UPI00037070D0|nr:TMEM165/GDT1 family protein [Sphingomonas sp. PR090111-T3T-6A]
MDALVPAFIVALLAELGDRTQLLAMLLGSRFRAPAAVLAGTAVAASVNMAIAGAAGMEIAALIPHRAVQLMTGLALLLAASGAVLRVKPAPSVDRWTLGPFASSAGAFFILALGDKTQFLTTTIAAGSGHPVLAAAGAAAGVTIANAPAVVLGDRWPKLAPLKAIRIGAGIALALAGVVLVIGALGLS